MQDVRILYIKRKVNKIDDEGKCRQQQPLSFLTNEGVDLFYAVARVCDGGIPKRSNGVDCKSTGSAFVGSNPAPPTIYLYYLLPTTPYELI